MSATVHVFTPTFRPAGGVVKIFDYVNHFLALGFRVQVVCHERPDPSGPLFRIDRFSPLTRASEVAFRAELSAEVALSDLIFFSWPGHFEDLTENLDPRFPTNRIVHIVQGVRHGNPQWIRGYATRLLSRPMSRIMVTEQVLDACRPWLNRDSATAMILEGHAWEYFSRERQGGVHPPVKVGYTTWKSRIGAEVEEALEADDRFEFISIKDQIGWSELRPFYSAIDVFLACPGPEEGFYLPGLEAMAAGAVVAIPNVGGNMAYTRFGENAVEVGFENVASYVRALDDIASSRLSVERLRANAYEILGAFTLDREQQGLRDFLVGIDAIGESG